jgi:hypothetical protein
MGTGRQKLTSLASDRNYLHIDSGMILEHNPLCFPGPPIPSLAGPLFPYPVLLLEELVPWWDRGLILAHALRSASKGLRIAAAAL